MNLFDLYQPLAAQSGDFAGIPYLLPPNFPLLLANTAFGFSEAALKEITDRFNMAGAPLAFTVPERFDPSELLASGLQPSATFELCEPEPSVRAYWTEHVPWSEAWTIARILTEAYAAPEWRFPFSQAVGKLLQKREASGFVAYLYGDAVGAILTYKGTAVLAGVVPERLGNNVGAGLIGRIHPAPFVRLSGTEGEFPGQVQGRFIRYSGPS